MDERQHQLDMAKRTAEIALSEPIRSEHLSLAVQDELWAPYLGFLTLYTQYRGVKVALEMGTFNGTSALFLSLAAEHVITVDMDPQPAARRIVAERENITLLTGYSCSFHDEVKAICAEHGPVGLLFLDSTHDGETPRREFEMYRDLLADDAVVIVDDLLGPGHLMEKMRLFWEWLPGAKIELHELHPRRVAPGVAYHDAPGFGVALVRRTV